MASVLPWLLALSIPVLLIAASSFVKISLVLGVFRNALGGSDIPPAAVLYALAVVLSVVVMAPVVTQMAAATGLESFSKLESLSASKDGHLAIATMFDRAQAPLKRFLKGNAGEKERILFLNLAEERSKKSGVNAHHSADDFWVVLPAFLITELREAFQLGLVLLIPFLVIDAVVHIGLIALGMQSLSAVTIALPLKLLIFVGTNGWAMLTKALISGYN